MRVLRAGLIIVVLLVIAIIGFVWWSQAPVLPRIDRPSRAQFDPALIEKGARLAAIGNCDTCHTARGGAAYAGGRPLATPFGTIYSSNITPAIGTGLGHYSEAAFSRAMREGLTRRGAHLYPVFPYDHYARLSDDDIRALYAFVMTRLPVEIVPPANDLGFPFGERWLLAFWNLLFLDDAPFRPDPKHDAEWNRGAYLVTGLGHCGSCHTPRNFLGAEKSHRALSGGEAEGWSAPALDAASPAPVPWEAGQLFTYLRRGWDADHGAAAGPMQPIVANLARVDDADIRAIAGYLATQQGEIPPARRTRADAGRQQAAGPPNLPKPGPGEELGATIFASACAACHAGGPAMVPPRGVELVLSTALNEADPRNAIRILLDGIRPHDEQPGPWMPPFEGSLSDAQLAALLQYLRAHYGTGPAWTGLEATIRDIRQSRPPT